MLGLLGLRIFEASAVLEVRLGCDLIGARQASGRTRMLESGRAGLSRIALVTHEAMTENQAIYARLGYVETGRRSEDGYQRIYMEKPLTG